MKRVKLIFLFALPPVLAAASASQRHERRPEQPEQQQPPSPPSQQFTEPAAFDDQTNGAIDPSTFSRAESQFAQVEQTSPDGLGLVYNAQSCRECHQNVVTGSSSQISELRAGHLDGGNFVGATVTLGDGSTVGPRSLINQRAICAAAQEYVPEAEKIRTLRTSLSTLGDGLVEAVPDDELIAISQHQTDVTGGSVQGEFIQVPILETSGFTRVGRFGWKDQHASLLSFSGDAYVNEMGVTNRFFPTEATLLCNPADVTEPNNTQDDIDQFAAFIRATKAPPRDRALDASPDAQAGQQLLEGIGCATCHVESLYTATTGTQINGDTYALPDAIANKVFHPFGDFLLHDIGTGDGIMQNGGPETADKVRTAPLWGTRVRPQKNARRHLRDVCERNRAAQGRSSQFSVKSFAPANGAFLITSCESRTAPSTARYFLFEKINLMPVSQFLSIVYSFPIRTPGSSTSSGRNLESGIEA